MAAQQADGTVIIDTELNTDGFDAGAEDIESAFRRMAEKLSTGEMDFGSKEIEATLRATADSLDGLGEKAKIALQKQIDAFANLNNQYEQQKQKVDELKQKLQEIGEQQIPTEAYTALEKQLQALYDKYDEVEAKKDEFANLGFSAEDLQNAYAGIDRELEEISAEMGRVIEKQNEMTQNGTAFTMGTDTEQYAQMANKLVTEEMKLENMNNRLNTSFATISNNINTYKDQLSGTAAAASQAASGASQAGNSMSNLGTKASHSTSGVNRLRDSLSKILTSCQSLISRVPIVGRLFSSLGTTGSGAISSITSNLRVGLGRLIGYTVGVQSVYSAVRKITSAVKEGFTSLREYSSEVDSALTSVSNSLTTVKNALATAFAPIVTAIAPYISQFCDMIATALNYVSAFFSVLTGKSTYTKAVSSTSSAVSTLSVSAEEAASGISTYAASADDAASAIATYADATEDAESAVEDYLSPLDELNKLQEDVTASSGGSGSSGSGSGSGSSGSGSGSGSYGSGGSSPSFVEEAIGDNVVDWANKFLEMWENADFTELGNILGEKLRDALDSIDWDKIQTGAAKVAKSLATLINGFVETEGLDESIGRTIGEAINTGLTFVTSFLDNTHFVSIGEFISGTLSSALTTIDWGLVGHTLSSVIVSGLDLVTGIVKGINWKNLPQKILDSIVDFVTGFDWTGVCYSIGQLLGSVIKASINLVIGIVNVFAKWYGRLKDELTSRVNEKMAEEGIDPNNVTLGQALKLSFSAAFDLTGESWSNLWAKAREIGDNFAQGIMDSLDINFDDNPKIAGFIEGFCHPFTGIVDYIWPAIQEKWDEFVAVGEWIWDGITTGITNFLTNIGSWVKEHIFQPFVQGIKNIFGISSPATEMIPIGEDIMNGMFEGMLNILGTIGSWLKQNILDPIVNFFSSAWEGIKTAASTAWGAISNVLSTAWQGIKTVATTVWNGITTALSTVWEGLKTTASTVFNGISTAISTVWSGIKTAASTAWSGIKTAVTTVWNGMKSTASTVFSGIKTTISTVWDNVKSGASTAWGNIKSTVSNVWDNMKSGASTAFSNIKSTISTTWDNVKSNASTAWGNIKSTISTAWSNIKSDTSNSGSGMTNTISTAFSNIKTKITDAMNGAKTNANNSMSNIKSTMSTQTNSMKSSVSSGFSNIKTTMTNMLNNAKSTIQNMGWQGLGSNIVSGVQNGVNSNSGGLMSTMKNLASNALSAAKRVLGISSPSRVFRDEVGKMIPAGISVGLERGFPQTLKTLGSMTDALAGTIPTWDMALPTVSLPRLAEGGVIPPRTVFAAVLGDQKTGNNIEAPESLLRKIVREESGGNQREANNSYRFTAQINRRTLFDEMITEAQIRLGVSGKNPFDIA